MLRTAGGVPLHLARYRGGTLCYDTSAMPIKSITQRGPKRTSGRSLRHASRSQMRDRTAVAPRIMNGRIPRFATATKNSKIGNLRFAVRHCKCNNQRGNTGRLWAAPGQGFAPSCCGLTTETYPLNAAGLPTRGRTLCQEVEPITESLFVNILRI